MTQPEQKCNTQAEPTFAKNVKLESRTLINKSAEGLHVALKSMGIQCRYNLRAASIEFRGSDENPVGFPHEWTASTDRMQDRLADEIKARFAMCAVRGGKKELKAALFGRRSGLPEALNALVHRREVDPFREYLDTLEPRPSELLDGWMDRLFYLKDSVDNQRLAEWAGRFMFLGAVTRTYEPGSKLDEMPVLISPRQGVGKSAVCRAVLPRQFQDAGFSDSLKLSDSNKQIAETLQGRIVVESSDMAGASRAELEHMKAALTRTDDSVRLSFRHDPEPLPRRCIIMGTANGDCLPNDSTGNRRFVVVEIEGDRARHPVESWMDDHRRELWAAAVFEFRQGHRANLPRELAPLQAEANDARRKGDLIFEDAVEALTNSGDLFDGGRSIKELTDEIANKLDLTDTGRCTERQFQMRLADALRRAGWTRERTRAGSRWFLPNV